MTAALYYTRQRLFSQSDTSSTSSSEEKKMTQRVKGFWFLVSVGGRQRAKTRDGCRCCQTSCGSAGPCAACCQPSRKNFIGGFLVCSTRHAKVLNLCFPLSLCCGISIKGHYVKFPPSVFSHNNESRTGVSKAFECHNGFQNSMLDCGLKIYKGPCLSMPVCGSLCDITEGCHNESQVLAHCRLTAVL